MNLYIHIIISLRRIYFAKTTFTSNCYHKVQGPLRWFSLSLTFSFLEEKHISQYFSLQLDCEPVAFGETKHVKNECIVSQMQFHIEQRVFIFHFHELIPPYHTRMQDAREGYNIFCFEIKKKYVTNI